jgi:hypothetical protein
MIREKGKKSAIYPYINKEKITFLRGQIDQPKHLIKIQFHPYESNLYYEDDDDNSDDG